MLCMYAQAAEKSGFIFFLNEIHVFFLTAFNVSMVLFWMRTQATVQALIVVNLNNQLIGELICDL